MHSKDVSFAAMASSSTSYIPQSVICDARQYGGARQYDINHFTVASMRKVPECTMWSGVSGDVVGVRLSRTHGHVACSIFHVPTNEVELAGAVARWGPYDAAELRCGHTFNVCALALHFLSNTMTCPVCRAGIHEAMSLDSVPAAMQQLFAAVIQPEPQTRVVSGVTLNFDRNDIAAELRLHVVRVNSPRREAAGRPVRLTTPLRAADAAGRVGHMQLHSTHRTFQRYFNTLVDSAGPDAALLVAIHHPLLEVPLRSALVNVHALATHVHLEVDDDIAIAYTENADGLTRLIIEVHTERLLDVIVHSVLERIVEG